MKSSLHEKDVLRQLDSSKHSGSKALSLQQLEKSKREDPLEKLTMKGCTTILTNGIPQYKTNTDNKQTANSTSTRLLQLSLFSSFFAIHARAFTCLSDSATSLWHVLDNDCCTAVLTRCKCKLCTTV